MNDAEYEAQCERIREIVSRWHEPLGLHLPITVEWHRGGNDIAQMGHAGAFGVTTTSWEYKRATIHFDVTQAEGIEDHELEEFVVHELLHVVMQQVISAFETDEITDLQGMHVERTVTELARAFVAVKNGGAS